MRLTIKVHPKASRAKIVRSGDLITDIYVTVVPENGKANDEVIKLLSKNLKIAKSKITIVSGHTSKIKIIDIQ